MGMESVSDFQIPFDFSDNFELKGLIDLFTSDAYQEFLPDPVERELDYAVIVFENDEFSCAFAEPYLFLQNRLGIDTVALVHSPNGGCSEAFQQDGLYFTFTDVGELNTAAMVISRFLESDENNFFNRAKPYNGCIFTAMEFDCDDFYSTEDFVSYLKSMADELCLEYAETFVCQDAVLFVSVPKPIDADEVAEVFSQMFRFRHNLNIRIMTEQQDYFDMAYVGILAKDSAV